MEQSRALLLSQRRGLKGKECRVSVRRAAVDQRGTSVKSTTRELYRLISQPNITLHPLALSASHTMTCMFMCSKERRHQQSSETLSILGILLATTTPHQEYLAAVHDARLSPTQRTARLIAPVPVPVEVEAEAEAVKIGANLTWAQ